MSLRKKSEQSELQLQTPNTIRLCVGYYLALRYGIFAVCFALRVVYPYPGFTLHVGHAH